MEVLNPFGRVLTNCLFVFVLVFVFVIFFVFNFFRGFSSLYFPEKPVLNKKNDTDFRVLAFGAATTIQSTALRGHPIPHFKWFQQPIITCSSSCTPDAKKWRRVPRSVINPSSHVPSRVSSLFLPPARSGYFFRCVAENSLGHDDAIYLVHRIGENLFIDLYRVGLFGDGEPRHVQLST